MSDSGAGEHPSTQPAFSGRPPRPPKITARGLEDQPDDGERRIYVSDPIVVRELARMLEVKPLKVVARLMKLRQFKYPDDVIDFATAAIIAAEFGYRAEKLIPEF